MKPKNALTCLAFLTSLLLNSSELDNKLVEQSLKRPYDILNHMGASREITTQESSDGIIPIIAKGWIKATDNYLQVHELISNKEYDKAKILLEEYLVFSVSAAVGPSKLLEEDYPTMGEQVSKINSYLREYYEKEENARIMSVLDKISTRNRTMTLNKERALRELEEVSRP